MVTRIENIIYLDAGTLYGTPPFVQDFNNNINMVNNRNNEIQSSNDDNTTDDGTSEQETDNDMPELE